MEDQITTTPDLPVEYEVVDIQFRPGQKVYFFDPAGYRLHAGDHVVIDTARGPEFGYCTAGNHIISRKDMVAPLRPVLRIATQEDERIAQENQAREQKASEVCMQKIEEHGLDMQLVGAECAFDGSRILFFFTADERVDFRDLVKNLASVFHTRIELRQIGVRDKAKKVGGLGICGRPFCCASFLDDFQPVSIKMAKTQNLSLNPTKISGTCGRLMCCLKYEQDAYEDLLRTAPKLESFVDTPAGRGTVIEVDLLRQRVKVKMEDQPEVLNVFSNADIAILRSGKAKKTDPPIPDDLAPISGKVHHEKKEPVEDKPVFLDSIRFRYSTETIAEETAPEEEELDEILLEDMESADVEEAPRPNNNRRRKPRKPRPAGEKAEEKPEKPEKPQASQEPKKVTPKREPKKEPAKNNEQKKDAPKQAEPKKEPAEGGEGAKKTSRRPYHRRRRPAKPAEGKKGE